MGISEQLRKQTPQKPTFEGLNGAGLGMAPPLTEHWLIANHLTSVIRPLLNNPLLEVGTESSQFYKNDSEDEKEDYYVLDVGVKELRANPTKTNIIGDNIFAVEICHYEKFKADAEKIKFLWTKLDKIKEGFVYDLDNKKWHRFYNGQFYENVGYSTFFDIDLGKAVNRRLNEIKKLLKLKV